MGIASYAASTVIRQAARAATAPNKPAGWSPPPPARHPGTVSVREGTVIAPGAARARTAAKPIDGALLWFLLRKYLTFYVSFRKQSDADLVAAWIIAACARKRGDTGMGPPIWRAAPRLLIISRKRGAGKSTLLDLIVFLTGSRRGRTPRITPARLAQITGQAYETVCIDEGKMVFGAGAKRMDLQACLLAGYTPNASYEVSKTSLSLFGFAAIATKESLITDAAKAVDGDESSLGDLLDRCLKLTLAAPVIPMPEVGERAEADGALLARALVAWTDAMRDELKDAAATIADEDLDAARASARNGDTGGNHRTSQIARPLRAVGRVIDAQHAALAAQQENPDPDLQAITAEADILTALAGADEAADLMAELQARDWAQDSDEDEPGRIVFHGDDGEEDEDVCPAAPPATAEPPLAGFEDMLAASFPPPSPDTPAPGTAGAYSARCAVKDGPGDTLKIHPIGDGWLTRGEAMIACEDVQAQAVTESGTEWEPMVWRQYHGNPGTFIATIRPAGQQWPVVSYAVSAKAGQS